jgi:hypothetical protein
MLIPRKLVKLIGIALVALMGVTAVGAKTRKGDKMLAQSRAAELHKDWDQALSLAEEALSEDPADIAYSLPLLVCVSTPDSTT